MSATVVLDQQVRTGTAQSASLPVPAGAAGFVIAGTMSDADAGDASKSALLYSRVSWDGVTYQPHQSSEWHGGTDKNGQPNRPSFGGSLPVDLQGHPPQRLMATLDTEGFALNTGLTIDFT
jgi:hypothetical protein